MPEGDTIYKIASAMRTRLTGAVIRKAWLRTQLAGPLVNCRIEDVYARGKHLFIKLEGGLLLRSHLARISHRDLEFRVKLAKQVGRSSAEA